MKATIHLVQKLLHHDLSTNSAEMRNSFNCLENSTPDSLGLTYQDRVNFHSR